MYTIFAVALFPDRNQEFLKHLCQNFRVIMFGGNRFETSDDLHVEAAEELLKEKNEILSDEEFAWELHKCAAFSQEKLLDLMPNEVPPPLRYEEFSDMYKRALTAVWPAYIFRQLAKHIKIDMVIGNADYSGFTRPTVIEAKRQGIPTLDIEHGYMAVRWEPEAYQSNFTGEFLFISDYVNLDNELEKQLWQKHAVQFKPQPHVTFLTHGTPNDVSFEHTLSREEAVRALNLNKEKFTVTIASGWVEARLPTLAIKGQIDEVEFFHDVLRSLSYFSERERLQIILKLHPAYAPKQIFADARNYLNHFADELGLEIVLVTHTHLAEVLSASNLIISPDCSSILWEGFLGFTPGIIYPYRNSFNPFRKEKLNSSNVLFREGCLRYVFEPREIQDVIQHFLDPKNRASYKKINAKVREKYHIRPLTAEEKSRKICAWIKQTLEFGH
ncbi:MAG: hypothetical protein ACE5IR_12380 [bacterium]